MKTLNWSTRHSEALIRGWVGPLATTGSGSGTVGSFYANNSGGDLAVGDVIIVDTSADTSVTTTATPQATIPVGVVQAAIASGDSGYIAFTGIVALVAVTASVTRGNYAETSATPGQATENATRRSGSFGIYLTGGTSPVAYLFGVPDP